MSSKCIKSCSLYRRRDSPPHRRGPYRAFMPSDTCQLYMAESSIPNSGLGMYTAVPISQNRMIFHPDIVVNYFDFQYHNNIANEHFQNFKYGAEIEKLVEGKKDNDASCRKWAIEGECDANSKYMLNSCSKSCVLMEAGVLKEVDEKFWVPDDYYWDAGNTESDYEADVVSALVPGLGALANSHTGLVNAHMQRGRVDATSFHRSKDPGIGAFSNFHNLGYMAKENIPAGMELFVEYGDEWFSGREWKFGPIPLSWHFEEADRIVNEFWSHADEVSVDGFAEDLFQTTKELITDVKLSMAMPASLQNAETARHNGTAILSVPDAIRSQEWLQENGICLDNIVSIQSGVQQAGRGAAATRNLKKGEVIAPLPVIHMDRRRLRMFVHDEDSEDPPVEKAEQLIVNYSYGHKDSSLLLFPYSPVVNFINNNLDKTKVNARVRWSTSRYHAKDWEDLTTDEVLDEKRTGLMLEIVATKDIEQSDEIFLDYGEDWDQAWNDYLKSWKPVEDDYLPLHMLNSRENILTKSEQAKHPLPSNAMTICFIHAITEMPGGGKVNYSDHASALDAFRHTQECEIERRYEEIDEKTGKLTTLYDVKVKIGTKENRNSNAGKATVTGVPRKAIEYVDTPYSSDQHLPHLFRHPIHIPDEIFPQKWRDLADGSIDDGQEFVHDTVEAAWENEQGAFEQCQFWLAESSIPNSGMGLYSGVKLRPGDFSPKEIIIPMHDREQNTKLRCDLSPFTCKQSNKWLIEDYEWSDSLGWARHEAKETFFANPGFGSIPNHHVGMSSACPQISLKSNGNLHRSRDAASGSISPYDSLSFEITRHVEAGQELFINYGEGELF